MTTPKALAAVSVVALAAALACACPQAAAQQMRLAKSLCASVTTQLLASQLLPPMPGGAAPADALPPNLLDAQRDAYFARLDALKPFSGLYATGNVDHTVAGDTSARSGGRYSVGLEYELFDQGRADSRRQLDRIRLDNKTQYLQLQRDAEQRQLQESLLGVEQLRGRLLATMYEREAAAVQPLLDRRKRELAAGRVTKADVAELEFRAERALLRGRHYVRSANVAVQPQAQALANRAEAIVLKPEPELAELAASRSPEHQLAALVAERSKLLPTPRDNLSVRFYAERAKELERGPQNVAGVRVRVPLGDDGGVADVAAASRELVLGQQESLKTSLRQKLTLLAERLRLKQADLRVLQAESRMLRAKADIACYRLDLPVASLPGDPDRDIEELTLRLHELQREILAARIDVLEVLAQLSALVKPREPSELYSLEPAPPPR